MGSVGIVYSTDNLGGNRNRGIMNKDNISELDLLLSSKVGQRVRVLVKVKNGMPDELVTGEIHHLTDTSNVPVLVMTNVRLEQGLSTYNVALNVIDNIQFLEREKTSIKKAAT